MQALGTWILEQACAQCACWNREYPDLGPLAVTVNVSGRQFLDDSLIGSVASALEKGNLEARNLILEITEGTMLRNTEKTVSTLKQLRDIGVRLAIDDFGTGYSSLSYLHKFPIDVLKIDKSFVDQINNGREGAAMARAIISMSQTLHLGTIAEGIENVDQIQMLQGLGCEMGQGYLFAHPLHISEMSDFLRDAAVSGKDFFHESPAGMLKEKNSGLAAYQY